MTEPRTFEDWQKVRKLYRCWAEGVKYWIPTSVYKFIAIFGVPLSLAITIWGDFRIDGSKLSVGVIFITVISVLKYMIRMDSDTQSFVEGFQQGIEFEKSDFTLDELIKTVDSK